MSRRGVKYSTKERSLKRRPYQRQRLQYGASRGMQFVSRTMGVQAVTEKKYFDSYDSADALVAANDWTGTEIDPAGNTLFYPAEGAAINQRIGRKVSVTKLKIRGHIYCAKNNAANGLAPTLCRMILYQDMQTNAAQAQGEQLMASPGAATALQCVTTYQNLANVGRFRVLKDKMITIQNPALSYDGAAEDANGLIKPFKFNITFRKPVVVRFNATNGGTVADIIDNSFHLIANCSSIELAPTVYYQCRVVYTDA